VFPRLRLPARSATAPARRRLGVGKMALERTILLYIERGARFYTRHGGQRCYPNK
jgi:hypothetical protein